MKNKKYFAYGAICGLLITIVSVAIAAPASEPPNDNLPVASFSGIKFPDNTEKRSAYARFLGYTSLKFNGNVGGYAEANAKCSAEFGTQYPGAHVCTPTEIVTMNQPKLVTVGNVTPAGFAWVSKGPSAYDASETNDCRGWSANSDAANPANTISGATWSNTSSTFALRPCDLAPIPFACCQ